MSYTFSKESCDRIAQAVKALERGGKNSYFQRGTIPDEQEAAIDNSYKGAFAVIHDTDEEGNDTFIMYGNNPTEGRSFHDYITLGLANIEVAETALDITDSCYVYVKITISNGEYSHEVKTGNLESNTNEQLIIPVAFVQYDTAGNFDKIFQQITVSPYIVQGRVC